MLAGTYSGLPKVRQYVLMLIQRKMMPRLEQPMFARVLGSSGARTPQDVA